MKHPSDTDEEFRLTVLSTNIDIITSDTTYFPVNCCIKHKKYGLMFYNDYGVYPRNEIDTNSYSKSKSETSSMKESIIKRAMSVNNLKSLISRWFSSLEDSEFPEKPDCDGSVYRALMISNVPYTEEFEPAEEIFETKKTMVWFYTMPGVDVNSTRERSYEFAFRVTPCWVACHK